VARLSVPDQREFAAVKRLCYRGMDSASLREAVGERLRRHLGADAFAFLALEPATGLPVHAVHDWPTGMCDAAHDRALLISPAADFGRRSRMQRRVHVVEQLASAPPRGTDVYLAEVLRPFGFDHEVQMSCAAAGRIWGNLHLTRRAGRSAFPASAITLLEALVPHVTAGLRSAAARASLAASPGGAVGMVLLGPGGGIELANEVALRLLRENAGGSRVRRWVAIQTVASLLARVVDGDEQVVPALDLVDGERDEVYRLRAERLRHADGRVRDLVLIEPGRLSDGEQLLPSLGLTGREEEVALAVLRGLSTKETAAALKLSPHTVQTHVRHIFEKLGVDSRRALASLLAGHRS
jgi:DNA-binding CsgD family transcriptional regulator